METLIELMKKSLADTFTMYLKSHNYHWNVEGINFSEFHNFFGGLYEELHGAVDPLAEQLRMLGSYVPGSMKRFLEITELQESVNIPQPIEMCRDLLSDNEKVINTLSLSLKFAEKLNKQGLINFLAGRLEVHEKHNWMLKSIIK
ncbi:DNA starvation/stationary phase protection protein [Candidatus Dojkabacteria bacterium]|jgi:starvation-inducible DNA-binding protein|nr:DNA starvation/stationary phase protection protein [Candidatus Dojkabacteria bacterium]